MAVTRIRSATLSLALDPAPPGIMDEPPRAPSESLIRLTRVVKILLFGTTMIVGTLAALQYGLHTGAPDGAMTLAFTTFVLFQFFNVFSACVEKRTSMNRRLFSNPMLWLSLRGVVALQIIAVHWQPAQLIFTTKSLSATDWLTAIAVASSVWRLEEVRKLIGRLHIWRTASPQIVWTKACIQIEIQTY